MDGSYITLIILLGLLVATPLLYGLYGWLLLRRSRAGENFSGTHNDTPRSAPLPSRQGVSVPYAGPFRPHAPPVPSGSRGHGSAMSPWPAGPRHLGRGLHGDVDGTGLPRQRPLAAADVYRRRDDSGDGLLTAVAAHQVVHSGNGHSCKGGGNNTPDTTDGPPVGGGDGGGDGGE